MVKLNDRNYIDLGVNTYLNDCPYQTQIVCGNENGFLSYVSPNVGNTFERLESKIKETLLNIQKKLKKLPNEILVGSLIMDVPEETCLRMRDVLGRKFEDVNFRFMRHS